MSVSTHVDPFRHGVNRTHSFTPAIVHAALPGLLTCPWGHALQNVEPGLAAKVFAGHCEQLSAPGMLIVPASQVAQNDWPTNGFAVPGAQSVALVAVPPGE